MYYIVVFSLYRRVTPDPCRAVSLARSAVFATRRPSLSFPVYRYSHYSLTDAAWKPTFVLARSDQHTPTLLIPKLSAAPGPSGADGSGFGCVGPQPLTLPDTP